MTTRARSHRPPPWRRPGYAPWSDAPVLPAVAIPGADIAAPGSVLATLRSYEVHVCEVGGRMRAYATDGHLGVADAACRHGVSATSGTEAKKVAIAEHRELCIQRRGEQKA